VVLIEPFKVIFLRYFKIIVTPVQFLINYLINQTHGNCFNAFRGVVLVKTIS